MWIQGVTLHNFLGFGECAVELDEGLNVVVSPNEGGKSSLLRAIIAGLYGDAYSRSADTRSLARWGSGKLYRIELALSLSGARYRVVRDFQAREQEIRVDGEDIPAARGKAATAFLRERLALDEDLFSRVCAVRHEELASVGAGPADMGERIERILGGGTGDRSPAVVLDTIEEKLKSLYRGVDGRANRENWGPLKRLGEDVRSLEAERARVREEERVREQLSLRIIELRARLARSAEELSIREERRARAARRRDLEKAEQELAERSRLLRKRIDRLRELGAERAAAEKALAAFPAFLPRCDVAALEKMNADLDREATLESELAKLRPIAARTATWRLVLGLCLVAAGTAGAVLWRSMLAIVAVAGAALVAWHALRPRGASRAARDEAARELEALRAKRAAWAAGATSAEARQLVDAARKALARIANVDTRLEELCGEDGSWEEAVSKLEGELGDRAIELSGVRREARDLEEFRLGPEAIVILEREIRAKASEMESLGTEIARAEGQLSKCSDADAEAIGERLEAVREELARAQRKARVLEIVADVLGEARRRLSGTLARRLPSLVEVRLAALTGGRYEKVVIDPLTLAVAVAPAVGDLVAAPESPSLPAHVSPDALSQGTRDQLYLAVRLALVDLLSERESQPAFLDDPFVHFDPERRERAVGMLREFARSHQVVLFTCDPAYRAIGGRLVELRR